MQRSAARDETPATRSALPAPEAMIARAKALELNTPYVPPPGFALTEAYTSAFLVTYKGRLIAERYMSGIGRTTRLESWSMGKSVVASIRTSTPTAPIPTTSISN